MTSHPNPHPHPHPPVSARLRIRAGLGLSLAFAFSTALAASTSVPVSAAGDSDAPAAPVDPGIPAARAWVEGQLPGLIELYRHLHANPELSLQEERTAARIAEELGKAGIKTTTGVGGHGVVGVIENGAGPVVLVRTDLDALPIVEETGAEFASKARGVGEEGEPVGVMHACGHDVHMTCFVGAARWLAENRGAWRGTVVLVGQPAEERVAGARAMLADGLYERFPKPDHALALHVQSDLPAGKLGYLAGPAMAGSTSLDLTIRGRGGHGAMPNKAVDPIVLSALTILDLQTIVSREISPIEPAVITVGSIHGGSKHNIIPDEVKLQLTLRAFKEDVREKLISGIDRRARALAHSHDAPEPTLRAREGVPPTVNTPELVARVVPALERAFGAENVVQGEPTMGAEDFGLFGQGGVPTFMFRLGAAPVEAHERAMAGGPPLPSLHSALFLPDPEPTIRTGVAAMIAAIRELAPPDRDGERGGE